ncbi:DUF4166 domain-containing protein [Roseibium sediminis]|uniref:DUF4166 domain-containing protein n=1 Tax=Roseibium sediminis TaxID=1775174 RepID=UPI00123D3212|nr:DUF4166 domain-containing protein [Roseibium sediminis]
MTQLNQCAAAGRKFGVSEDPRFRDLLGLSVWKQLPDAVRRRFGRHLGLGESVVYRGTVVAMRLSIVGRTLAYLARIIGGPLPYDLSSVGQAAIVSVTEDGAEKGQFWIRQYGRASGFPQVVHSSKRFAGPTGIEEYVGAGIGMALKVCALPDGLSFQSAHYFLQVGPYRLRFPAWLAPGDLTILHRDLGQGRFLFSLTLKNRLLGELIHQDAVFQDSED